MKKILTLLIGIISFLSVKSQKSFPFYYIKGTDTIGMVFSIKQAQGVDNDLDLLKLLKESKVYCDSLNVAYISVVDNFGEKVAELTLKIKTLEEIGGIKDRQILNLQSQVSLHERDQSLANSQSMAKDSIINNYKGENKKLKGQRAIGFIVGGGGLIGALLLVVLSK